MFFEFPKLYIQRTVAREWFGRVWVIVAHAHFENVSAGRRVMRVEAIFSLIAAWLMLVILSASARAQATSSTLSISFDFRNGSLGWQGGFADYPPANDDGIYMLRAEMRDLPSELGVSGTGFYFQGKNHSDDLFMFMKRRLAPSDGLVAGQAYWLDFKVVLASNAQDCGGVGGPPGFGVVVKVGGAPAEPRTLFDGLKILRLNVDKWNQLQSGIHASVAGDIWNGLPCNHNSTPYVSIERTHRHVAPVLANSDGELWLLVGTDSGFEGLTGLYYQRIDVRLTPLSAPPPPKLLTTRNRDGSASGRAAALDSVAMTREPFSVLTTRNFSHDQQTRLILFAYDMELGTGEDVSVVTAQAEDAQQKVYRLAVEAVRKVPDWEWITQVVVRLPPELANTGDVSLSIELRGVPSNKALVRLE